VREAGVGRIRVVDFPIRVAMTGNRSGLIPLWEHYPQRRIRRRGRGRTRRMPPLGLDSEIVGQVKKPLWTAICTPGELAWLRSLPRRNRPPRLP